MWVQFDAPQVDDPGKPGRIVDDNLFGGSAGRKRQCRRAQPGGPLARRPFLIKGFPFRAMNEPFKNDRPIANACQRTRRHRQVVANQVEFRKLRLFGEI